MKSQKWWHRPRPTGFLNFGHEPGKATEYVETYIPHKIPPAESFKPAEEMRKSDAKVSDKTTFRRDYIPHPLPKHDPPPKEVYHPPEMAMDGVSMYRQDYPGHPTEPVQLARRKDARTVPLVKFEANPTYTSDFKRWAIPPRMKYGPEQMYKKPDVKMDGTSTFREDFVHRYAPPRESAKPPNVAFQSEVPLQSYTVHSTDFVPYQLEPRMQREKEKFIPPTVPMDSVTTFQTDFTGPRAPPAESMKPSQTHFASKDPLSSSSEFRDSFVAWPVVRPRRPEPLKYAGPQGNIELITTHRVDFRGQNARPASPKRPAVKRSQTLPFDGTTNYSTDFKRWQIARTLGKPRQEAVHGGGKFEGLSTTKQHFIRHSGAYAAKSCKPDNRAFMSDAGLEDKTIYKISYVPQSMEFTERYPTPDWLKQQEEIWKRQGLLSRSGSAKGLTPRATPTVQAVA